MPLAAGTRLGAYEITGPIGAGGMGEVYRADDARLRRTVASKILPPHLATPDRLERFEQEARAARELGLRSFVDGSVRVEGSRVRVSAELVDARTRESLWSQQYERELAGLLAGQRRPKRRR